MSADNGLCEAFRDLAGRTFRCVRGFNGHCLHYGIAGQQRNYWNDGAMGAHGARFVPVNPPTKIAPDYIDQPNEGTTGDVLAAAPRSLVGVVGGPVLPYPDTGNLAVPYSGTEPQEPPFSPDKRVEPGKLQKPYVQPYATPDT